MSEIIQSVLLIAGGLFGALASLGLVRMPDVLIRMHASTKAGTLSCGLIIVAAAVHFGTAEIAIRAIAIIIFLLLTAPIAAHMIGRAAFKTGVPLWQSDRPESRPTPDSERASEAP
ncbi:MAG: monovalent cation/H(+) antiporter subunit G [Pseudomonadota bacterium]